MPWSSTFFSTSPHGSMHQPPSSMEMSPQHRPTNWAPLSSAPRDSPPRIPQASLKAPPSSNDGSGINIHREGISLTKGAGIGAKRTLQTTQGMVRDQAPSKRPKTGEPSSAKSSTQTTKPRRPKRRKRTAKRHEQARAAALLSFSPSQPWIQVRHGSSRLKMLPWELLDNIKDHLHAIAAPKALRMLADYRQGDDYN